MTSKKLIKLEKINYKNQEYRVFVEGKGRRVFLKIASDGTYTYPNVKIYLELDRIYNNKDITIVYLKENKSIKKQLLRGSLIVINVALLCTNTFLLTKKILIKNGIIQSDYLSYNVIDYDTANTLAYQSEDVLTILKNNKNIENDKKAYIKKFITCLNELKPSLDLNIFKTNLKDLKIISLEDEEFKKKYGENVKACFLSVEKTIFYNNKYDLEETIYHELGHLTNVIYFEDKNLLYHVEDENGFGNALYEGFNSVFSNSLMDKQDNAYIKEQCYIKIISEIIGSKEVEKCYFGNGDIVEKLSKYVEKEEVKRIIMLMDDLCSTSKVKDINTKETELEITKKLLEWSRISAKKKYYELKDKNIYNYDLDQACCNQLMNTSSLLSLAFGLPLDEIKKLEEEIKDDDPAFESYKTLIENDPNYFEKFKEQFKFIYYKKFFMDDTIEQLGFEYIAESNAEYNK